MTITNFGKFRLLLWKNWVLQWKHKTQFAVEVLLPVVFAALLVLLRTLVTPEYSGVTIYNETFPIDYLDRQKLDAHNVTATPPKLEYHLAYSPTNEIFENIVKEAAASLNLSYSGYANYQAMEDDIVTKNYLTGVAFQDSLAGITKYPDQLDYRLRFPSELRTGAGSSFMERWLTNYLFVPMDPVGPRNKFDPDGGIPSGYLSEGFLPVQNAISMAFINQSAKNPKPLPKVFLQRYPYPEYINDPLLSGLADVMAMIILLSYIYTCTSTTKYIVTEKEKQLKEVMKIMGLQNWLHWTSWFVKNFLMMAVSALLITCILLIKWSNGVAVLTYSSFTAVLFFLLIYMIATITLCFMFSTIFSKASTAAAVMGLIWFIMYIPYTFFSLNYSAASLGGKIGWSLLSNTAMGLGVRIIIAFETRGEGLQWSNMFSKSSVDDALSMGHIIGMMCLSSIIYMIICLYLENIWPGEFGVPKKWYFPFTKTYWCGEPQYIGIQHSSGHIEQKNPKTFEVEPTGKKVGVELKNLNKTFGDKNVVQNLSLNMYEDEITVLLGHNGAGKTTTISMLTGMFSPTSGTAIIDGSDIRSNIDGARMSMGICPQHNILFDDLTVRDHLIFFSRLKGLHGAELEAEVTRYIKKIELEDKANVASSKLSGGMKRKLSVCAAFCGGTKVVLCDEPSSGMDPAARRQLWDLMQSEKIGRTVLLTTHFMDEADVLGDRIAIMSAGKLGCYGTSFFLKKNLGSGYLLICVKQPNCDSNEVTKLLNKYIPDIQPEADIGAELSYKLPDRYSSKFEEMFQNLEKDSEELLLNGYGISITSLEEVFMKLGSEKFEEIGSTKNPILNGGAFESENGTSTSTASMFSDNQRFLDKTNLLLSQWHSMILKKFLYTFRNKLIFAIQNIIPILFIVLTIVIATMSSYAALKPMTIAVTQYPSTVTVLETTSNVDNGSVEAEISENYRLLLNSYSSNHELEQTGSRPFIDYILELGKTIQVRINARYIAAATVDKGNITAWLNNKPIHSAPLTVNLIHNAMARTLIGPGASIVVTNDPLPYSHQSEFEFLNTGQSVGTQLALNLSFCMCFITSIYVLFLVKEKQSRAKLLQFVNGVNVITFWAAHYVWDLFTFLITVLIVIITLACFQEPGYASFEDLGRNFVLMMLFGCSILPLVYVLSNFFTEPATGFARLSIISILFGNAMFLVILIMGQDSFDTKPTADALEKLFMLFPHFALTQGLNELYVNNRINDLCSRLNKVPFPSLICSQAPQCCNLQPYFAWTSPGVLSEITYLVCTCILFFLILAATESRYIKNVWFNLTENRNKKLPPPPEDGYLDADVEQENERIRNMTSSDISRQNLVLDSVTKFYGRYLAVNQISVGVKHSECFGLLGVNGAGKTSTFKMLTGDEKISSGEAYVKGLNLKADMKKVYHEIGYCPQFDAIFDDFTGRETLKIFALLRGIPGKRIPLVSAELARSFGFMQHYDKQVHAYSGGNKRKLSTALAIMGSPSVIYLDEPTTGMDPAARRQLWNMVSKIRDIGKAIVLTSHSMEECEALCTRLAVMVNGEFKCIGSSQHLKNKFSKGLILKLKIKKDNYLTGGFGDRKVEEESNVQNVMEFIKEEFPEAFLKERFQGIFTFYIPVSSILWSRIFGLMERNKDPLNIEDYSISQTTLEEIFLQFARYQRDNMRKVE